MLGYAGILQELSVSSGAFIDIGGASTEIVLFEKGRILLSKSYRMGSIMKMDASRMVSDKSLLVKSIIVMLATVTGFVCSSSFNIETSVVALSSAVIMLIINCYRQGGCG